MKPLPLLLSVLCVAMLAPHAGAAQPNVLIFLADDAGWGDYSASGNRQLSTPNIDSLARDGASLERFYVCPVCAPTRAEFLTGRYHSRTGVYGVSTGQERMDLDERTLADAFKAAGYATGAFGKWHNGSQWPYHPNARGFDEYYGYTSGHWGEYFDPPLERNGRMERAKGYIVDACTDEAIGFIERNKARPFLCYVPLTTPHSPWAVPDEDWKRFADKPITQLATLPGQENVAQTRCALAMVENQDRHVGRVLRKVEELGLTENTIVIYFSDNGPNSWRWNGGMKGRKGGTDEGSVRSVCFWRWPGRIPKAHNVKEIAGAIDLLPTLTSLAGIKRAGDKPLDGLDLSPLLRGEKPQWPARGIFTTINRKVSMRTQQYRLDDAGKLYDMQADPAQTTDVSASRPDVAQEMRNAVEGWRAEVLGTGDHRMGKGVDARPIPVGYREFPITMLPARDGTPLGGVKRSGNAPNCSYFVNWTSKEDRMEWNVEVANTGTYEVTVDYTCKAGDEGSTVELELNGAKATGKVAPAWDPPLYTNQDTLPRGTGESQMKEFKTLSLGTVKLEKGRGAMVLRATEIPGKSVMDVRRVTLTLQ